MAENKAKKFIKQKFTSFKIKNAVGILRRNVSAIQVQPIRQFAKWIIERDSTSVTFRCSQCGFEYTDADPDAQCEYKGCPMCLSVIDGTIEDKPVLRNILNDTSNKSVEFLIKETEGIITLGWRLKYIKDGNYYGDYIEISQYSTGDDIGEAVSLLFGQLHSCLDALNDEGENVISSEKEDSWRSAVMRTFLGGEEKRV